MAGGPRSAPACTEAEVATGLHAGRGRTGLHRPAPSQHPPRPRFPPEPADERERPDTGAAALGEVLAARDFLVGETLSVADIVTVGVLFIAQRAQLVSKEAPANVQRYFAALGSRPALADAALRTESILQPSELLSA